MSGPLIRVSGSECVCALTCLFSGVWGQRMLFQGHCWCGTKWTSPGGRPVTSGRPLTVSTTAVTSLLGHTEQTLFDTAWLWWIAATGLCCLFALEQSCSGFSVKLCVSKHMWEMLHLRLSTSHFDIFLKFNSSTIITKRQLNRKTK